MRSLFALAVAAMALAGPVLAQAPATTMRTFADVAASPAGDRVAAVETDDPLGQTTARAKGPVVVRDAHTGAVIASYDPCGPCRYSGLAWSPHGETLAFIAFDPDTEQASLDVLRDGKLRTLVTVEGVAQTPRFSPDGRLIALMAIPGAHKETGAVEAGAEQVGDIGALAVADEKRIAVIPAAGGALRYVSAPDTFVYEYDWRPDGRGFVATAAKGNGDNNWWIAKLVAIDLDGGTQRVIAAPTVQMNAPRVSPDGNTVAFIGGLMSDFGSVGGDIYTVPLDGGTPVDVTPGIRATFTSLVGWRGGRLMGTLLREDHVEIVAIDSRSGTAETFWSAPVSVRAADAQVSLSADGRMAATEAQDFTHAPEIWAGAPASLAQLTRVNAALLPQATVHSVTWKSDGFDVQGWLLAPLNVAPGKHPMVVDIHGGPSAAVTPRYVPPYDEANFPVATWLRKGYFVFYANPRGSYGQGEAFARANIRDFGGGDLRDILAGVDKVETIAPVDEARLGVFGHSYGGYMTMWTVTHSHRFAAAITGAGISDWISYYGENGIDKWMIPFFGASAYEDPAIYEKLSPIFNIKNARTPTLIYVGERDVECPAPQSFEFWHALEAAGVPTSFVVFKGQGHAIHDPTDLADLRQRELAWFDKYLGG